MKRLGYKAYFLTLKVWDYIKKKLDPFKYYILVIDILLILALPFAIVYGWGK